MEQKKLTTNQPKEMERKTLKIKELAQVMGISEIFCYQLVHRPDFYPAFRIGKRILINVDRLNEWLAEQEKKSVVNSKRS